MSDRTWGCLIIGAVLSLFFFVYLVAGVTSVDAGSVCVMTRGGDIKGTVNPGWHWKWPGMQEYHCFSTRTLVYETGQNPKESGATFTDYVVGSQTNDGQSVSLSFSVLYHVPTDPDDVMNLYRTQGTTTKELNEKIVKVIARSASREHLRDFDAADLYSGMTSELETEIEIDVKLFVESHGLVFDDFLLRDILFDVDYLDAIEQKEIAREQRDAASYKAEEVRTIAEGERDAQEIRAEGEAQAMITVAEAEAATIILKGEALRNNPEVLQLYAIERLNPNVTWGILPSDSSFILDLEGIAEVTPASAD